MANTVHTNQLMMSALAQAEQLAQANPQQRAVIYRKVDSAEVMKANTGGWTLFVRLSNEPAPEGAEKLTTVSRKPPDEPGNSLSLGGAVRHVLKNLPEGVTLSPRVVVERYPRRAYQTSDSGIFAYQFMTTEGRNIATWIPDVAIEGVNMQAGFDGRGREFAQSLIQGTQDIGWLIEEATKVAPASAAEVAGASAARRPRP